MCYDALLYGQTEIGKPYKNSSYFFPLGKVQSIRHRQGSVLLFRGALIDLLGEPIRQEKLRKYLARSGGLLWLQSPEQKEAGLFRSSRVEQAGQRAFLLYGAFDLHPHAELLPSYRAGVYKKRAAASRKRERPSRPQVPKWIRHHKDYKLMLYIPSSYLRFGQDTEPSQSSFNPYFRDTRTKHLARIKAFYMDKYEVSNAEYLYFCQKSAYPMPIAWQKSKDYPPYGDKGNHPFHRASYKEAQAYARWAGKRLPTEWEWELAARGSLKLYPKRSPPIYPTGDIFDPKLCNILESGHQGTLSVYSLQGPSPYGMIGMCGNAREWTSSWLAPYRGQLWPSQAPKAYLYKVIRGASFAQKRSFARADYRDYGGIPGLQADYSAGFRLVLDAH